MGVLDLLLAPLYLGLFYFLASSTISRNANNPLYKAYYLKGLIYKLGATIFFALIYIYYYKGGDSLAFYYAISPTARLLFSNPAEFFYFVTGMQAHYPVDCLYEADVKGVMYLLRGSPTLTTIRIGAVINLISFDSYIVLCLFFAYISYYFQWKAYELMVSIYPAIHKQLSYAFLMIPSVLFWGSGVGKDSIMLGSIMLLFYCFYRIAIHRQFKFKYILLLLVTMYLITLIRSFILYAMVPCMLLMVATYYRNSINSTMLKFAFGPLFIIIGVGISIVFIQSLGQAVDSYSLDSLQQKAEGFKSWHSYLGETQGGSGYSLGSDLEYTPVGILKQAPMAMAITLYGPFIWQVNNAVMLMSAIESLFFLFFTISVIVNRRFYLIIGAIMRDHILVFCLPLVLILSIAIGLTSFNYGALVRYRIPILPFLTTVLVVINYHLSQFKTSEGR